MSVKRLWALGFGLSAIALGAAPGNAAAQVRFERTGFRMTSIGERVAVSGRVLDARRRPVPSTRIRWRIADPTIATVSPQGVVVSRRAGNTRLWAVTGADSTSALIVVDQWAAKFEFAPTIVRLDAVGAKAPVRIGVRDAEGHPINDASRRAATCRSLNERVAVLSPNGEVTARANGVTYVRCTDRGVADSVRIEVRQRPAKVMIADKQVFTNAKVVGEVFTLRLTARDRSDDEIRDPQASWASLNPTIISVDPVTGATRAVGAGTARVVAQVGDVTDTLTIPVSPSLGQPVPANSDTATTVDVTTIRVPTLRIEPVFATEGEEVTVRFTARDAAGAEVPNPEILLRSADTSIFAILPRGKLQSKGSGSAYVVGKVGNAIDSALVTVRAMSARVEAGASTARASAAFVRPQINLDSLRAQRDSFRTSVETALRDSRIVRISRGRLIALDGYTGETAYSFSDSTGAEKRAGVVIGGTFEVGPFRWLRLGADFRSGTLTPTDGVGTTIKLTQIGGDLTIQPAEYLGLRIGYMRRALNEGDQASLALQRWDITRVSAVTKLNFVGGRFATVAGFSILPFSKYSGNATEKPEPFSYAGEAGIAFQSGWFRMDALYGIERLQFPKSGDTQRIDQLSTLRLRMGLIRAR
jgi:hypothetical protein